MADREIVQQCEQLLQTVRELSDQMENRSQSPANVNSEVVDKVPLSPSKVRLVSDD